ncbi:MAG TPA: rhodanese-like domain-containing protein [Jiangellales bacterium]|nr:rhodanese-like domain-containing protein [Jiangellales bacterium]
MITPRASWWGRDQPPRRSCAAAGPPTLRAVLVVVALLGALVLVGCGTTDDPTGGAATATSVAPAPTTPADGPAEAPPAAASPVRVSAAEAVTVLAEQDVTVLDVRTPEEFAAGHLPDAVNVDLAGPDFDAEVAELPTADTYLVYCRSGNRSAVAAARMAALGFTSLYDVQGGIQDWQAAGGEVVR